MEKVDASTRSRRNLVVRVSVTSRRSLLDLHLVCRCVLHFVSHSFLREAAAEYERGRQAGREDEEGGREGGAAGVRRLCSSVSISTGQ